jgi:hypothetical protein
MVAGPTSVPDRPDWLYEVKYDGYRLRAEHDGDRVRLITRGGYATKRFPWTGGSIWLLACLGRRKSTTRKPCVLSVKPANDFEKGPVQSRC